MASRIFARLLNDYALSFNKHHSRYFNVILRTQVSSGYVHNVDIIAEETTNEKRNQSLSAVDFQDFKTAYSSHSLWHMSKSLFIFRLCSYNFLVDNSLKLIDWSKMIFGRKMVNTVMKSTFHGQFVGGETLDDLRNKISSLQLAGIGPMLCVPIEEDVGETSNRESRYDRNLSTIIECIQLSAEVDPVYPMSQIKLTALVPADLCCRLSGLIADPLAVPERIDEVVKYLKHGEAEFDYLTEGDRDIMTQSLARLRTIAELGVSRGVRLVIDAEYTYLNPALRLLSLAMMLAYNTARPLVAYTYQSYLKDTFSQLEADERFVRSRGACFGVKLVRGAYMEKERQLAATQGYQDPVHVKFEGTTMMYHRSLDYLLGKVALCPQNYFIMAATHNEASILHTLQKMKKLTIHPRSGSVFFGQIYGMCDFISYNLGLAGHNTYKSIPYGSVEDTLPYLHRRALENRSVLGGTQKERQLLWKALVNRVSLGVLYKTQKSAEKRSHFGV